MKLSITNMLERAKSTLWIALVLGLPTCVLAEQSSHSLTDLIAQLVRQHEIEDIRFSPDGSRAAFVVRGPSTDGTSRSTIWLYNEKSRSARRFTSREFDSSSPRWAPDGSKLAFLSTRDDRPTQIYVMRMDGGAARELTDVAGGVRSFEWSPAHGRIAFSTTDSSTDIEGSELDIVVGSKKYAPAELLIVDVVSGEARKAIHDDGWAVGEFAWLPAGEGLVLAAVDAFLPERAIDRVFTVSIETGELREIGRIESVEFGGWQVSPRGNVLAYVGSDSGPTLHDLFLMPLDGGPVRNLTGAGSTANIDRPVDHVSWIDDDELVFVTADGLGSSIRTVSTRGRSAVLQSFTSETVSALDSANGKLLYAKASAVMPIELWHSAEESNQRITNLHAGFPELVKPHVIHYASSDDEFSIEAMVHFPRVYQEHAPMVTVIHGGPTGRFSHSINNWAQVLAASGYVVFAPNIRGSIGYGEAFMMSNRAEWGAGDFQDVMAGIDYLVEEGVADEKRLAIAGWSYGGYMSAWATTQTQRFKAAVVGAAMLDLEVQWGAELPVIVAYDTWYLGTPWDQPENFRRLSPISHVKNVATPTLLMVGEQDAVDHPVQSWQYFRALRMRNVPTELIVYPREGHSIKEEAHARDVLQRVVDWVDIHLK